MLALFSGGVAFAVVGGGNVIIKNKGGDVIFSHEVHVDAAGTALPGMSSENLSNTKNT